MAACLILHRMADLSYSVACILQYLQIEVMLEVLSSAVGGGGDSCEGGKRRRLVGAAFSVGR